MARRAPRTRRARLTMLVFSSLVTLCVTVVLAISLTPVVVRHVFLNRLADPDPQLSKTAMVYVLRHATEPALQRALIKRMADPEAPAKMVHRSVRALKLAGVWGPNFGGGWVRWLQILVDEGDASRDTAVALEIAEAGLVGDPVMADPKLGPLVEQLLVHEDPNVRYAALRAAATMPIAADAAKGLIADAHPTVARLARMVQVIAEGGNLDALASALAPASNEAAKQWRQVLAGDGQAAMKLYANPPAGELADVIAAAAASRLAPLYLTKAQVKAAIDPVVWTDDPDCFFRELAVLENLPTASVALDLTGPMPDLVRAAAVRVAKEVSEDQWLNAFDSEHVGVRQLVALAAIERLDRSALQSLAEKLNRTFYDNERKAGALLVGLAGLNRTLLDDRLKRETIWVVRQHVELGLYMLGVDAQALDPQSLLARTDVPRQSVVLAMIHRGRVEGLDALIRPLSGDGGELRQMFDQQRFWPVLQRYLPVDGPRFDLWADPALQQAQVDILRTWFLMHRTHLHFDVDRGRFGSVAR